MASSNHSYLWPAITTPNPTATNECPPGYIRGPNNFEKNFAQPHLDGESEMDFNAYKYYVFLGDELFPVPVDQIRKLRLHPENPWSEWYESMLMIDEHGRITPAHLPNYGDLFGRTNILKVLFEIQKESTTYSGVSQVVPDFIKHIASPKPKIKFEGVIQSLSMAPSTANMASFSDGLQILHTVDEMSLINVHVRWDWVVDTETYRVNVVCLSPENEDDAVKFRKYSPIILWNVRDVCRPSFVDNFKRLCQLHRPCFLVLTETRVFVKNWHRVLNKLDCGMESVIDETVGNFGGAILMWNPMKVRVMCRVAKTMTNGRMVAKIRPIPVTTATSGA